MKKKDFVSLILGTAGGLLFAIGMCLIAPWNAQRSGVVLGVAGAPLLGVGLCCTLLWPQSLFIPGIAVGIAGLLGMIAAYPLCRAITSRRQKQIAGEILRLSDALSRRA